MKLWVAALLPHPLHILIVVFFSPSSLRHRLWSFSETGQKWTGHEIIINIKKNTFDRRRMLMMTNSEFCRVHSNTWASTNGNKVHDRNQRSNNYAPAATRKRWHHHQQTQYESQLQFNKWCCTWSHKMRLYENFIPFNWEGITEFASTIIPNNANLIMRWYGEW